MKLEDTIKGFAEILEGKHDDLPEQAFYMVGTIEKAVEKGRGSAARSGVEGRRVGRRADRARAGARRGVRLEKSFSVSLVTPDGAAFEGEAEMIIVPGAAGEIGVLARHAPLIATLKAGSTRVHVGGVDDGPRVRDRARASSRSSRTARSRSSTTRSTRRRSTPIARGRSSRRRRPSSRRIEAGESDADRWQLEQRIRHAENQLDAVGASS